MLSKIKHIINEQIEYYKSGKAINSNYLREQLAFFVVISASVIVLAISVATPSYSAEGSVNSFKPDEGAISRAEEIAQSYETPNAHETSYITHETGEGIGYTLAHPMKVLIDAIVEGIYTFLEKFNIIGVNDVDGSGGSISIIYEQILDMTSVIGGVVATFLFLFTIFFAMFMSKLTGEEYQNPLFAIGKFVFSVLLIKFSADILQKFLATIGFTWQTILRQQSMYGNALPTADDILFLTVDNIGKASPALKASTISQVLLTIGRYIPLFAAAAFLVNLALVWPLAKQFFALAVEVIERYLVLVIIYALFPLAAGFINNRDTIGITKKYFTMLGAQIIVIASNGVFLAGSAWLFHAGVHKSGILGYIFVYSYLKAAQRFDSYLQSMGFNVAQTGGSLFDSLQGAVMGMTSIIRQANNARRNAGGVVAAAGATMGAVPIVAAGNLIGASTKSITSALEQGRGGLLSRDYALERIAESNPGGTATKISVNEAASIITKNAVNHEGRNQKMLNLVNENHLRGIVNKTFGTKLTVNHMSRTQANKGIVRFDGKMSNGMRYNMQFTPVGSKTSYEVLDEYGDGTGVFIKSSSVFGKNSDIDVINGLSSNKEYLMAMGITNFEKYGVAGEIAEARYSKDTNTVRMYDAQGNALAMFNQGTGDLMQVSSEQPVFNPNAGNIVMYSKDGNIYGSYNPITQDFIQNAEVMSQYGSSDSLTVYNQQGNSVGLFNLKSYEMELGPVDEKTNELIQKTVDLTGTSSGQRPTAEEVRTSIESITPEYRPSTEGVLTSSTREYNSDYYGPTAKFDANSSMAGFGSEFMDDIEKKYRERYGSQLDMSQGTISADGNAVIFKDEINHQNVSVSVRDVAATGVDAAKDELTFTNNAGNKFAVTMEEFNNGHEKDIKPESIDCEALTSYDKECIEKRFPGTGQINWESVEVLEGNSSFIVNDGNDDFIVKLRDVGSTGKAPQKGKNEKDNEKSYYKKSTGQQIAIKFQKYIKKKA